ncbi:hypothetical protein CP360_05140 [Lactobacillus sp. UMNPBX9]|uniref:hypothetical protein n=2 Tax=Lactobacillaceae TaxID=33958 RepID=UPI000BEF0820|nr:hypothetical protein [Ligilactobacillus salivarius]MBZ4025548.1 hypothetical protein [Ligilactobacillus salivarius]MBZ4032239.1 hypothetical protein [Ligilactobacillus salivarius]PEG96709.1 hypothetical protein CP360_05140 [Lactobacillus sp. UMNPBX9]PEH10099.1 hypothetical protein CP353_04895 [Lactobacillus sp. UMNPBX2]
MQEFIFENQSLNGNVKSMHKLTKKLDEILEEAGFTDINSKTPKEYYYTFSVDKKNSKDVKSYINDFTTTSLANQVFVSKTKVADRMNLFGQNVSATEIDDVDGFLKLHPNYTLINNLPVTIAAINDDKIEEWLENILDKNKDNLISNTYLYNELAMVLQIWAVEHNMDPNKLVKKLYNAVKYNTLRKQIVAEKVYNDPRSLLVDNQLMVLNDHHIYTAEPTIVNGLIDQFLPNSKFDNIMNARKNVHAQLMDSKFENDKLDDGFKSPNQSITIQSDGNIQIASPLVGKMENFVNVDYIDIDKDSKLKASDEYKQVIQFLTHISGGKLVQLLYMLGFIPLQNTGIMAKVRRFFILLGVPGAGKTVLASLLEKIFNNNESNSSCILTSESNVNKALTDPNLIDANDTKKGQLTLWFDDFQTDSQNNAISSKTGTAINGIISGKTMSGAAKFQQYHDVKLPSLIVIATNALPQIRQVGTADRMFVFNCNTKLYDEVDIPNDDAAAWINNPKVQKVMFSLIIKYASKLVTMSKQDLGLIFSQENSAQSSLSNINSSLLEFLEAQHITCSYDLIGMGTSDLFETYKNHTHMVTASYRTFKDQIKSLGLKFQRKHFQENYYSNVIVSGNKTLDNGKMKDMLTKYSVLPDKLFNYETTDDTYTLQHWHENFAIYREECGKDKKTSKLFIPFNFND